MNPIEALSALKAVAASIEKTNRNITSYDRETILSAIQELSGDVVVVPRDQFVLCPKCEGKKGFNIAFPDNKSLAYWEHCVDCRGTGKILASRLALMLSAATPPAESDGELKCHGCGRPYSKGPDLVVSDADWARIKPDEKSSQVMCPNCMNDAFEAIGAPYGSVEARFTSGPLAQPNWKKPVAPDAVAGLVERVAKAIFFEQCSIMHDHEENWKKSNQVVWKDSARAAIAAYGGK